MSDNHTFSGSTPVVRARYNSIIAHFRPEIVPDSAAWFAWLTHAATQRFAFYENDSDGCLCHLQKRDDRWYAYRTTENKLHEVEIVSSEQVTVAALWNAYHRLNTGT